MPLSWDVEADVVVVGFGAAGVAAAVTAHDLGAKVVMLEKAPEGQQGGNTRVAGQGYLNTSSVEKAIAYLHALCGPYTVPEPMVRVWAEEMGQNNAWVASIGGDPQEHQHQPVASSFPTCLAPTVCTSSTMGRPTAIHTPGRCWSGWSGQRPIEILYETPGSELIQHGVDEGNPRRPGANGTANRCYIKARRRWC